MQRIKCLHTLFFTLAILSLFNVAYAQTSIALGPGITSYSGDISGPDPQYFRPAVNFEIWYQFNPYLYGKAGTSLYQIYAEDIHPDRNRAFRANHYDAYLGVILAPSPNKVIMPYVTAGIGITKVDPEHKVPLTGSTGHWWLNSTKWLPDGRPIPSPAMIYPIGVGVKIRLAEKLSLLVDGVLRITNTDMLDGVGSSEIYVAEIDNVGRRYFETIRSGGLNEEDVLGNGNPDNGDTYGIFSIKLQYHFGKLLSGSKKIDKINCPTYE